MCMLYTSIAWSPGSIPASARCIIDPCTCTQVQDRSEGVPEDEASVSVHHLLRDASLSSVVSSIAHKD